MAWPKRENIARRSPGDETGLKTNCCARAFSRLLLIKPTVISSCHSAVIISLLAATPALVYAVQPSDGFFFGIEMDPVGNAAVTALETEPAVALIFAADQKTADVTRQFNEWYNSPSRPAVEAYAIAVEPGDTSSEVLLEAINQRKLDMPVFIARSDMLLGDDFRIVVLNNDQEVQRFTTLDVAGVNDALAGLGITIPEQQTPASNVETGAGTLPDGSAYSSVTTTTTTDPVILGGPKGDSLYLNETYGMSIQFPPGWRYQVAANQDGAVAFEPTGSKMDMRLWALAAEGINSAQEYMDQTLEALAEENRTRVNVERNIRVVQDGSAGVDVTYNYTRLIDGAVPARGALLYRGRIKVFLAKGVIKAARVAAPSGEFLALFPTINSFISSFENAHGDIPASSGYGSPNNI